jgi:sugar phosphate permease
MWLFGIIQYVRLVVLRGIAFWLPSLLLNDKGISLQVTGFIIALRATLIAPSNMLGGYVSDRIKKPLLIIGLSLIMLSITSALFGIVDNMVLLIALIVFNSIFVQFYFGPLFATPTSVMGAQMQGTCAGFGNFFANIGGFTFVYLLGVLKDVTGLFSFGFYAIAGSCIIGLIATALLARTRQKIIASTE